MERAIAKSIVPPNSTNEGRSWNTISPEAVQQFIKSCGINYWGPIMPQNLTVLLNKKIKEYLTGKVHKFQRFEESLLSFTTQRRRNTLLSHVELGYRSTLSIKHRFKPSCFKENTFNQAPDS